MSFNIRRFFVFQPLHDDGGNDTDDAYDDYDDHYDQVKTQVEREPYEFPTLEILNKHDNINDYSIEDFKLNNYQHHDVIKGAMRA